MAFDWCNFLAKIEQHLVMMGSSELARSFAELKNRKWPHLPSQGSLPRRLNAVVPEPPAITAPKLEPRASTTQRGSKLKEPLGLAEMAAGWHDGMVGMGLGNLAVGVSVWNG